MGYNSGQEGGEVWTVDYDPQSLQYMLDFFRDVAQSIPTSTDDTSDGPSPMAVDPVGGASPLFFRLTRYERN